MGRWPLAFSNYLAKCVFLRHLDPFCFTLWQENIIFCTCNTKIFCGYCARMHMEAAFGDLASAGEEQELCMFDEINPNFSSVLFISSHQVVQEWVFSILPCSLHANNRAEISVAKGMWCSHDFQRNVSCCCQAEW